MDLQDVFISNMKRIRKERHITQEKLAELCGTDTSYIGQIETKKRFPSVGFIERIAGALDVAPYVLFKDMSEGSVSIEQTIMSIRQELLPLLEAATCSVLKKKLPALQ